MLYSDMSRRAERIQEMIRERAKTACHEAGLDPNLLGIHPHNAMCAYRAGKPWKGVNYSKCRLAIYLSGKAFEPVRVVERWYLRQSQDRLREIWGMK